jgi:transketolase
LPAVFAGLGWRVVEIDGHDFAQIVPALKESIRLGESSKPTMIVAHTIKGKGISFTEGKFVWHSKVATEAELQTARTELQIEEVK